MTDTDHKARENRARRAALRRGMRLERARTRDQGVPDFGTYHLVDDRTGTVVIRGAGHVRYGLTLDDVEQALNDHAGR